MLRLSWLIWVLDYDTLSYVSDKSRCYFVTILKCKLGVIFKHVPLNVHGATFSNQLPAEVESSKWVGGIKVCSMQSIQYYLSVDFFFVSYFYESVVVIWRRVEKAISLEHRLPFSLVSKVVSFRVNTYDIISRVSPWLTTEGTATTRTGQANRPVQDRTALVDRCPERSTAAATPYASNRCNSNLSWVGKFRQALFGVHGHYPQQLRGP